MQPCLNRAKMTMRACIYFPWDHGERMGGLKMETARQSWGTQTCMDIPQKIGREIVQVGLSTENHTKRESLERDSLRSHLSFSLSLSATLKTSRTVGVRPCGFSFFCVRVCSVGSC